MHDHTIHVAYDCTKHQTMALLPMMYRFVRKKLASYTACCSVFAINSVHEY